MTRKDFVALAATLRQVRPASNFGVCIWQANVLAVADVCQSSNPRFELGRFLDACGFGVRVDVECDWFALCSNSATGSIEHPVLGEVPICDRCRVRATAAHG